MPKRTFIVILTKGQAKGKVLSVTDPKNKTTDYTYDTLDRRATRTDALNRQESYQYDPAGNLTQFTDRKNQQSTYSYDALNRRNGAQYANGRSRTFDYDALNRRIRADYADGSFTPFRYDAVGRLTAAEDSLVGRIEFLYDLLDRLSKEISAQGVVEYSYDPLGRRTSLTANGQAPVSYQYDTASRLIQVAQAGLVVGLGYDAAGRRTSLTYPNGTSTSYSYDNASRLTNILHQGPAGVIESLSYVYDAAGNRISLTRANGAASVLPAAVQAAYDAANEQLQFGNPLPPTPNQTFDANGNLTSDGTNTYTWDARNRLVAIAGPGLFASFTYDALGRRVSKTINGVTTSYLYDGNDIVQEIGGGAVGASYVRSLNIDEPFVRQTSAGNEFNHMDALGSSLALSNGTGTVSTSYSYEAFGRTGVSGPSSNPFQYTGRENDGTGLYYYRARYYAPINQRFISEDVRIVNNIWSCIAKQTSWFRNPVRILLSDDPVDLDLYQYARNSPIAFIDRGGLQAIPKKGFICDPCPPKAVVAAEEGLNRCSGPIEFPHSQFEQGERVFTDKLCIYSCENKKGERRNVRRVVPCKLVPIPS